MKHLEISLAPVLYSVLLLNSAGLLGVVSSNCEELLIIGEISIP